MIDEGSATGDALSRRLLRSAGWSAAFLVAFAALYALSVRTHAGQVLDARSLGLLYRPGHLVPAARLGMPFVVGAAALVAVVGALVHRRWAEVGWAIVAAGLPILASGFIRDDLLGRPHFIDLLPNSYPSRHVVVTCALGALLVRVWPWVRSRRTVTWLVVAAVVVVSVTSVAAFAHRASDTIAGVLLIGMFAPLFARGRLPGVRSALCRRPAAAAALCGGWLVAVGIAAIPLTAVSDVGMFATIVVGTGSMAVVVLRLVAGPVPAPEPTASAPPVSAPEREPR